jgi:hypothetical protein
VNTNYSRHGANTEAACQIFSQSSSLFGDYLLVTWIEGGKYPIWRPHVGHMDGVGVSNMAATCLSRGSREESKYLIMASTCSYRGCGRVSNTAPTYQSCRWRLGGFQYGAHLLCRVEDMVENILEDRVGGPEDLEQAFSWRPDEEAQAQEAVLPALLQGQAPRLTAYKKCCGSMTFWGGSGSADPCLLLMDPAPAIFVIDLQDASKKLIFNTIFSAFYFLKLHLHHFSKIKSQIESQNSRNQGFSYYFCMMIEGSGSRAGSGSGSIPLTIGSGSGRPKNMWIRWIRIRNTAYKHWVTTLLFF